MVIMTILTTVAFKIGYLEEQVRSACPSPCFPTKPGHPRCLDGLGLSDESEVIAQRHLVHVLVRGNSFLLSREV